MAGKIAAGGFGLVGKIRGEIPCIRESEAKEVEDE
jgi:hypothetical protein